MTEPPSPSQSPSPHPNAPAQSDQPWMAWVLVACTVTVFAPVSFWIVKETAARQQIRQSLILLVAAAVLVAWQHRHELRVVGDLGNRTLALLGLAFGLVGVARSLDWPLLVLPGLACGLGGTLNALFGAAGSRFFKPLITGVLALAAIIITFPLLDWPLRQLAGVEAAHVLNFCNLAPRLSLAGSPSDPQLLITVGTQVFHVATECNGFGIITSGALLSLLASGISNRTWFATLLLIPLSMIIGFAINVLRIFLICLNAPYFPGYYHAMHEIIGTLSLWLGLGVIGLISWRSRTAAKPPRVNPPRAA
jgi:exosortase/archaeosortase family protein